MRTGEAGKGWWLSAAGSFAPSASSPQRALAKSASKDMADCGLSCGTKLDRKPQGAEAAFEKVL